MAKRKPQRGATKGSRRVARPERPAIRTPYVWTFDHQILEASAAAGLKISVAAQALLHWSTDDWKTARQDPAQDLGGGAFGWEFPPGSLSPGDTLLFTFFWPEGDHWEGRDFTIAVTK